MVFGFVRKKIAEAQSKARFKKQLASEIRAKNLKQKAFMSKKLEKTLKEEKKALAQIERTKKLEKELREKKYAPLKNAFAKLKKRQESRAGFKAPKSEGTFAQETKPALVETRNIFEGQGRNIWADNKGKSIWDK